MIFYGCLWYFRVGRWYFKVVGGILRLLVVF